MVLRLGNRSTRAREVVPLTFRSFSRRLGDVKMAQLSRMCDGPAAHDTGACNLRWGRLSSTPETKISRPTQRIRSCMNCLADICDSFDGARSCAIWIESGSCRRSSSPWPGHGQFSLGSGTGSAGKMAPAFEEGEGNHLRQRQRPGEYHGGQNDHQNNPWRE